MGRAVAWANAIDLYLRAKAYGKGMGEGENPTLGSRVCLGIGFRHEGPCGTYVYNGTLGFLQINFGMLGHEENGRKVDRKNPVPFCKA